VKKSKYQFNVFVNCPFDDKYKPLFQAIVFTIHNAGYIARCALEIDDASKPRLNKIMNIIEECKYAVHDISRTEPDPKNELPRFNMPLELGIFLGSTRYGKRAHREKSCLIFDKEKYRYQKFISDIAGQDIAAHKNNQRILTKRLRDWLRTETRDPNIPGGSFVYDRFVEFKQDLPQLCKNMDLKIDELTYRDYVDIIGQWLENYDKLIKEIASMETLGIYKTTDGKEYDCLFFPNERIAEAIGPLPEPGQSGARGPAFTVHVASKKEAVEKLVEVIGPGVWQ